jgi:cytochrome bd-type quinol oxidase subunit 1
MAFMVAGLQTAWFRTNKVKYLRATKFFGKLFLINFAIGVVTGIVQEFQFGMNWSSYSRFVGDVFGAPLAMEGLLAFFLREHILGIVDLWMGSTAQKDSLSINLACRDRNLVVGLLYFGRQCMDATSSGVHHQ